MRAKKGSIGQNFPSEHPLQKQHCSGIRTWIKSCNGAGHKKSYKPIFWKISTSTIWGLGLCNKMHPLSRPMKKGHPLSRPMKEEIKEEANCFPNFFTAP